ncbi:GNAT family N-acetyltransferase [Pedobacter antarcticus]|uniref:GNAT family N-acetyltransferase n=1 Tax=Pedobacter antarcticus TaxID=34086 RepID=UPI000881939E|nr:GNAT family N-acetyltransferase [Pedobacter antarcticus]SDM83729.1 Acetyltransferase (GNAT) family protein [Pedobacter antarcticus]
MIKAEKNHKSHVIEILTSSFDDNQSVNYIVKQDIKRKERIRALMDYSFEICFMYGAVYLSDDKKGCALVLYPDKKKFSLKATWEDIKLVLNAIGISRAGKAMSRESAIKSNYPQVPLYYLWFLGVQRSDQNKGIGSKLLNEIILDSQQQHKPIYLETSTIKNIPWYQKFGFEIYNELDFGYKLFMLRRGAEVPII